MTTNTSIIKDPNKVNERIFVGNLPIKTTREELESICTRYGNVLCSMVQKNFGFVQFDCEETANKAASALHGSTFKGNRITVRNAGKKPKPKENQDNPASTSTTASTATVTNQTGSGFEQQSMHQDTILALQQQYHATVTNPDYNDCEIIVVNKQNTEYAEYIEQRLKRLFLKVDLLFPNEEVPIGKVLANISTRGCLYAILVTPQNQEHRSITVNILYGQPAEHRNMPVDDAINLIANDFQEKIKSERQKSIPMAVPIIPTTKVIAPPLKERHPEAIQTLLNLLADNLPLTVLQYDRVISYLNERRELQIKAELGDAADIPLKTATVIANTTIGKNQLSSTPSAGGTGTGAGGGGSQSQQSSKPQVIPDPEIELQKKIFNILNKSTTITDTNTSELVYPDVQSLKDDPSVIELIKDERVQRALNSLMKTSLVATIENYFKF